tara:strand:+ start:7701 stop:8003 length:303 start_codon:yes stop_codon:yes gene_type:complete
MHLVDKISDTLADYGEIQASRTTDQDILTFRLYNVRSFLSFIQSKKKKSKLYRGFMTDIIKDALIYYIYNKYPEVIPEEFKYGLTCNVELNTRKEIYPDG